MSIEDQIAREAADQIVSKLRHAYVVRLWIEDIVLAAIKRAVAIEREIVKQDDRNADN